MGRVSTIYVRDVPDDVTQVLKDRAAAEGKSLSAYVAARLTEIAARPTNADIVDRLRSRRRDDEVSRERILDELHAARR